MLSLIKVFVSESPHLIGFFKGSQKLQQNSEYNIKVFNHFSLFLIPKKLWNVKSKKQTWLPVQSMKTLLIGYSDCACLPIENLCLLVESTAAMALERGAHAEWQNYEVLLLATAYQHFDTWVKCPTGRASFWIKFHTVQSTELSSRQMPGVCPWGVGGGGGDGLFWNWLVHNKYCNRLLSV